MSGSINRTLGPAQLNRIYAWLVPIVSVIVLAFAAARLSDSPTAIDWFDNLHWTVAYLFAAILGWYAARHADEQTKLAKRWFAYGLIVCAVAQLCWDLQTAFDYQEYPAPSDAIFLLFGPCCAWGMLHSIRQHPSRPLLLPLLLDVTALAMVVLAIVVALFLPHHNGPGGLSLAVTIAYPISMLSSTCVALIMWPTLRLKLQTSWLVWVLACLLNGMLWLRWIYVAQVDSLLNYTWMHLSFSLITVALGVGAVLWRTESSTDPRWAQRSDNILRMLPLLVVGGAAISVGLAWSLPDVSRDVAIAISIGSVVVFVLAIARQSLLLYERERLLFSEQRANELERTFQTLFHITRGGLALIDQRGRFHETNPGCSEMLGYSAAELQQLTLQELWIPPVKKLSGPLGLVDADGNGAIETECRRKNGSTIEIELTSALMPHTEDRIFVIFRDITERKRAAETQTRLEAQLRQSQKLEAIGTLASGIAHDFNNILGAILGNTELAAQDIEAKHPAQISLNEVRRAGLRARELIARIVAFGKPQELNFRVTQLSAVIEDSMKLVRAALPATVQIHYQLDRQAPSVRIDSSQIGQILLNLCTNAYQAMPQQKGRIDIRLDVLNLTNPNALPDTTMTPGHYVCLHVSDNGSGIDSSIADRIFEPFFTTKAVGEGSGLGLSIVHNIVRSHGGAIVLHSELGKGSVFHVYLPIVADDEPVELKQAIPYAPTPKGSGQHILYVDDEEPLVFLTTRMLERYGYRVSGFTEATAALSAALANDGNYDLIITDQSMPSMSGIDLARELLSKRPQSRIVLVSGYLSPAQIEGARAIGIQEVILKPDTIDELVNTVDRLFTSQSS